MNASTFSEPFTPRGVATFAHASYRRLFLAQLIFALIAAIAVAWLFHECCFPVVRAAINNLPDDGEIRSGKLDWQADSFQKLAEGDFFAFDVDVEHSGQFRSTADFQVEFGRVSVRVFSLFGYYADFYYPSGRMPFNRIELVPIWSAWHAIILFFIAVATVATLLASWSILATIYFLPVRLAAFFTNRDLDRTACWKLSGAALLPGALLMTVGILLYGLGLLNLVTLCFIFGAHLVLGLFYLVFSLGFLPRLSTATSRENPFKRSGKRET